MGVEASFSPLVALWLSWHRHKDVQQATALIAIAAFVSRDHEKNPEYNEQVSQLHADVRV